MKITKWDEQAAEDIGHAFGYYDYGQETGMGVFYSSKDAVANYIAGTSAWHLRDKCSMRPASGARDISPTPCRDRK